VAFSELFCVGRWALEPWRYVAPRSHDDMWRPEAALSREGGAGATVTCGGFRDAHR
jgi:hypothetical protein